MFPSVAFPPSVIFPSCANADVVIDIPSVDVAAAIAKAATATNIVATIPLFMFEVINRVRTTNYIIVLRLLTFLLMMAEIHFYIMLLLFASPSNSQAESA
jgi:hypothetical protein